MKFKYLGLVLTLSLSLTGCPKSTSSIPNPPPITPPVIIPPVVTPPVPSPTVYSITDIQTMVAKTCGTCGNTGGQSNSASAVYNQTLNVAGAPQPNSGHVTMLDIAAKEPYANAYWYWPHTAVTDKIIDFNYEFSLYIPAESLLSSQAIEWEMQVSHDNNVYNYAYQLEFHSKEIRVFNYTTRAWVSTGISTGSFTPDTWHHVIMRNNYNSVTKVGLLKTLTVDYTVKDINIAHAATPKTIGNQFTNAFQLDSKKDMLPYKVFIDKMRLTWYAAN